MSEYRVIFSTQSKLELKSIFRYIAKEVPKRAISFVDEMKAYFETRLQDNPLTGQKVKGEVRMIVYKRRYGILYLVNEEKKIVQVLHIFSGGQDWEGWLD